MPRRKIIRWGPSVNRIQSTFLSGAFLFLALLPREAGAKAKEANPEYWDAEWQYNEASDTVTKACSTRCHYEVCTPFLDPSSADNVSHNCRQDETKSKDWFTSVENGQCNMIPMHQNPDTYTAAKRGWKNYIGRDVGTADCVHDYQPDGNGYHYTHKLETKNSKIKPGSDLKNKALSACYALGMQAANKAVEQDAELFGNFKDRGGVIRFVMTDTTSAVENTHGYGTRRIPYQRCVIDQSTTKTCRAYQDVFDFGLGPSTKSMSVIGKDGALKPVIEVHMTMAPSGDGQSSCLVPNDEAIRAAAESYMQIKSPLGKAVGRFLEMNISKGDFVGEAADSDAKSAETVFSNPVLRDLSLGTVPAQ